MPRNGSGTYNLVNGTWYPAVNGVLATSSDWNVFAPDIAAALTQSISSDGQTAMTGNLPMGGNKLINLAPGSATTDSATFGQLQSSIDQFVIFTGAPTFISTTSFSLVGNQTAIFQGGRRVRTINSGGTVYSTIVTSVFGAVTTVTVRNDGSSVLDSGISQVSYGLVSTGNSSVSGVLLNVQTFVASGTYTPTIGTTKILVVGAGSGGGGGGGGAVGGAQVVVGGGGSSGAVGMAYITSGFTPTTAVTIGAVGAGVAGNAGTNGGASSFGTLLTLAGGIGGQPGLVAAVSAATGGSAVSAGGTALMFPSTGQAGTTGIASFAAGYASSGGGGSTQYGSGGPPNSTGGPSSGGNAGTGRGTGGGGSAGIGGGGVSAGGNGTAGVIIVYEYS